MEIIIVLFVLIAAVIMIGLALSKFTWRTAIEYLIILLVAAIVVAILFHFLQV